MADGTSLVGGFLVAAGVCFALLGLLLVLPVGVNLPESWTGAVLALAFLGGGTWMIARGVAMARSVSASK
jgi:hypothetical protein